MAFDAASEGVESVLKTRWEGGGCREEGAGAEMALVGDGNGRVRRGSFEVEERVDAVGEELAVGWHVGDLFR